MALDNATSAEVWVTGATPSDDGQSMTYSIQVSANSGRGFGHAFTLPLGASDDDKDAGVRDAVRAGLEALGETVPLADTAILIWAPRAPVLSGNRILGGSIIATVPNGALGHSETLAATGVLPTMDILIRQDARAYTDDDENAPDWLHVISLSAVAGTDEITVTMEFGEPTSGPIKLKWRAV